MIEGFFFFFFKKWASLTEKPRHSLSRMNMTAVQRSKFPRSGGHLCILSKAVDEREEECDALAPAIQEKQTNKLIWNN